MFLGYAELFHKELHGMDESSYLHIEGHYITIFTIKNPIKYLKFIQSISKMDNETYYRYICENANTELHQHQEILFHIMNRTKKMPFIGSHPLIKNFLHVQESLYPQLQLFEKIILPSGESISILKTFWIKCIQRKWKKICKYNKTIVEKMKTIDYIKRRERSFYTKRMIGIVGLWHSKL